MRIVGRMAVFPAIPERIARLHELAFNLWWSWHPQACELYASIDPHRWEHIEHNAVRLLSETSAERLENLAGDESFLARYDAVMGDFDAYMHPTETWFTRTYPVAERRTIAYFCAEFGLHESLPIYSGGLGVLAGDHCKEASDLDLPFVGIGFLYPQGYFRQRISRDGKQEAIYEKLTFAQVPATAATGPDGREITIGVELPGRTVYAKVWRIQVGRIPLFLIDTDVEPNAPADRTLSARLYAGDAEMRIAQETMLGVGGVRTLRALGIEPSVWHMNEGHAAFMGLERCRELVRDQQMPFAVAREVAAASAVFTTHTPVAAGNDVFGLDLIDRYFADFWPQLGLDRDAFNALGQEIPGKSDGFSMTALALRLSARHNGVSRLHGAVSRRMWRPLWPDLEIDEVPIGSITNGVHTPTWLAPRMATLYDRYLGDGWREHLDDPHRWERIRVAPDRELWEAHRELKAELISFARSRLATQRARLGEGTAAVSAAERLLSPNALTIGFARRFATYKRATLLFRDTARLSRLLSDPLRPVQLLFAGKAHPADGPGQEFIRTVYKVSRQPEFEGKIAFLEDYDMAMARHLVAGADIWLNTPVRPHEASGTSGQKAALNGLPNCSILDGWWEEGYNGHNGWAIGGPHEYQDDETRDEADATSLYDLLEHKIVPLYFDHGPDGLSRGWIAMMKDAIATLAPRFSMRRMLSEYIRELYLPAEAGGDQMHANHDVLAHEMAEWKGHVRAHWGDVRVRVEGPREGQLHIGQPVPITAHVTLGGLRPEDVAVEVVVGRDANGEMHDRHVHLMQRTGAEADTTIYHGQIEPHQSGSLVYGVRVVPVHVGLTHRYDMGLALWA